MPHFLQRDCYIEEWRSLWKIILQVQFANSFSFLIIENILHKLVPV